MTPPKPPPAGIWCPAVTFFNPATDDLDLPSQKLYYNYLSTTGLRGLVILGTNAETLLLTRNERATLLQTARSAVGPDYPLIAGVSGHSTKQVLEYIADAHDAKADYALVLPCAYFGKQTTPSVVHSFYDEIAEKSPLPVVIYNFPAVCNGVDLDAPTILSLAKKHDNIVGVKLTCGSVAKITCLAAEFPAERFSVFGGQSDFLVGGLSVGSAGCIAAFANVVPRTIVRVYDLYKAGKYQEALEFQRKAALAEAACKGGIAVTKYAAAIHTAQHAGVTGTEEKLAPRRPYQAPDETVRRKVMVATKEVMDIEDSLSH